MEYKANTIEELFGTLQQSIVESWRKHLKTSKYSSHMALNDFYEDMPDLVDQLIEDYMGVVGGKVDNYKCIFTAEDMDVYEYLKALRTLVKDGAKKFLEESELKSDVDSILSLIDSTLYKLKELSENKSNVNKSNTIMSLKNFLLESMNESRINESRHEGEKMYNGFKKFSMKTKNLNPDEINKLVPEPIVITDPWIGECISMYVKHAIDSADAALQDEYKNNKKGFFEDEWDNIISLNEIDFFDWREQSKLLSDDVDDQEIIDLLEVWLPDAYKEVVGSDIELPY